MASHDTDQSERPATLLGSALARVSREALAQTSPMAITHGTTVTGDVTDASALLWARASAAGRMLVEFWADSERGHGRSRRRQTTTIRIDGASDFIGKFELNDLTPDTMYFLGLNQRSYGSVVVDPRERTTTVDLKLQDGTLRHRTVIREATER